MNKGAVLMRSLENVRGEFSMTALAYTIRRALKLVGVQGLIAARMGNPKLPSFHMVCMNPVP